MDQNGSAATCPSNAVSRVLWNTLLAAVKTDAGIVGAAQKAAEVGVKRYVEVSTAFVYKSQVKQPAREDAELQPWTLQAKYKLEVCGRSHVIVDDWRGA